MLETLPGVFGLPGEFPRELRASSGDPDRAAGLAQRELRLARLTGDPRHYGYALAALQPWRDVAEPPPQILYLRAKLHETQHNYEQARRDLTTLLEQAPDHAQAWLDLSNLERVGGFYARALEACDGLEGLTHADVLRSCRDPIRVLTGEAEATYLSLRRSLPILERRSDPLLQPVLVLMGETAAALGRQALAEKHLHLAYAADPTDLHTIRAYTDQLLDGKHYGAAHKLASQHLGDPGLLLRAAISARHLGDLAESARYAEKLAGHFGAIRRRGDRPHGRYEARYALAIADNPERALEIALENWEQQKELRDTRTLLEAALAAGDPTRARPAIAFLRRHRTESVVLERLIHELESRP